MLYQNTYLFMIEEGVGSPTMFDFFSRTSQFLYSQKAGYVLSQASSIITVCSNLEFLCYHYIN